MEPINYNLGEVPDPTQALMSGLKVGSGIQDMRMKQQQMAMQQLQQQQMQADLAGLSKNPSPENIGQMMLKYPSLSENFKRANDVLSDAEKDSNVKDAWQVLAALKGGKNDIAMQYIQEKSDAYKNSGNEKKAKTLGDLAKMIEMSPETAKTSASMYLASTMGPDKFAENYAKLGTEERAAEEAPAELAKKKADAEKSIIEARYKEQEKIADLEKTAADLGLSKANTNKAIAETKKLGVEAAKALLELQAIKDGTAPPKDAFDFEEKLRKEYQSRTKGFDDAITQYNVLKASADDKTGAGDIALVTAFNKMLDPSSVVRETEFSNSRDTAGTKAMLENFISKKSTGQFLTPTQRADFVRLAGEYYKAAEKSTESHKNVIGNAVKNYKLNPDNVFGNVKRGADLPSNAVTVGDKTYTKPANFTDAQWEAYKKSQGVK